MSLYAPCDSFWFGEIPEGFTAAPEVCVLKSGEDKFLTATYRGREWFVEIKDNRLTKLTPIVITNGKRRADTDNAINL